MTQSGACLSRRLQMNEPGSVTTPNMFTFSLTFVRHGETQYNRDKLLQGQGVDTLLSETGAQQGEAVGRYLSDVRFSRVFVSNLQRAVQTAEIILRNSTHCSGMEMIMEPLLRERGFGVAEGRPKEDLKNMANAAGQSCRDYTPPGGETLEQVRSRFQKFLKLLFEQMLPEHDGCESEPSDTTNGAAGAASAASAAPTDEAPAEPSAHVLVVSHGAYIRVAARHLLENLKCSLPPGAKASQLLTPCPNTGVSRYVLTLRRSEAGPVLSSARCLFTNRKEHLETLSAAQ